MDPSSHYIHRIHILQIVHQTTRKIGHLSFLGFWMKGFLELELVVWQAELKRNDVLKVNFSSKYYKGIFYLKTKNK